MDVADREQGDDYFLTFFEETSAGQYGVFPSPLVSKQMHLTVRST